MVILKKPQRAVAVKVPTRDEINKIIDCIDKVVNESPTLALRYSIIAEKVNQKFNMDITVQDVHNYYDTYTPEENKLSNAGLDKYLTLKNVGLV